jgi:DNA-binding LacI/PurR family transcriptional regulator
LSVPQKFDKCYNEIKVLLNKEAKEIANMAKISIKHIAELTNLSPGTISIVLNGRGDEMRISSSTQARIWAAAKQIGYQPNIHARRLRQQSDGLSATIIGILWPSMYSNELLVRFFDGIQRAILEENYNIEVIYKPYIFNEIYRIEDVFKNNPYNGIIIIGASYDDIEYIKGTSCSMPTILFNRQDSKFHSVGVDDFSAGERVASLFAVRGHKTVALLDSDILIRSAALRRAGFITGCQGLGLTLEPAAIISSHREDLRQATQQLLALPNRPTALFLPLTTTALDVYEVLNQGGVRIPEDIEIISYGDTLNNRILRPTLTVIDLPLEDMVLNCLQLILDIISGKSSIALNVVLETRLVVRQSCGGFPENGK